MFGWSHPCILIQRGRRGVSFRRETHPALEESKAQAEQSDCYPQKLLKKKKKYKRKLQIPPHDSCLQHYSPEMIQNDASGPRCYSPPLEFPCVLRGAGTRSARPPASAEPSRTKITQGKPLCQLYKEKNRAPLFFSIYSAA